MRLSGTGREQPNQAKIEARTYINKRSYTPLDIRAWKRRDRLAADADGMGQFARAGDGPGGVPCRFVAMTGICPKN
jgi:hypothetical protein